MRRGMPKRATSDYDWQSALAELGWSKAELARRMGLHVNTVGSWGKKAPRYVEAFLMLCTQVHEIQTGLKA